MNIQFNSKAKALSLGARQGLSMEVIRDCSELRVAPHPLDDQTVQIYQFKDHFEVWVTRGDDRSFCIHSSVHRPDRHYNE